MAKTTVDSTVVRLDAAGTDTRPVAELTMGQDNEKNYVWLGDEFGRFFATIGPDKRQLRALRDLLNKALAEGGRDGRDD